MISLEIATQSGQELTSKIAKSLKNHNDWTWSLNILVSLHFVSVTNEDKNILFHNYGKEDEENVKIVKEIYSKYEIRQKYLDYSVSTYESICQDIENNKSGLPAEIFQDFLDKIHKRSK